MEIFIPGISIAQDDKASILSWLQRWRHANGIAPKQHKITWLLTHDVRQVRGDIFREA